MDDKSSLVNTLHIDCGRFNNPLFYICVHESQACVYSQASKWIFWLGSCLFVQVHMQVALPPVAHIVKWTNIQQEIFVLLPPIPMPPFTSPKSHIGKFCMISKIYNDFNDAWNVNNNKIKYCSTQEKTYHSMYCHCESNYFQPLNNLRKPSPV